jgi:hypothetical protein
MIYCPFLVVMSFTLILICYQIGNESAIKVSTMAARKDLIFTLRACRFTWASSASSSIFSSFPDKLRELREASPTQVLSRH